MPAARRVAGIKMPTAPNNSNMPLIRTAARGHGIDGRHDAHFHSCEREMRDAPEKKPQEHESQADALQNGSHGGHVRRHIFRFVGSLSSSRLPEG